LTMTSDSGPPILPGCTVLPPMHQDQDRRADRYQDQEGREAKGKPARRRAGDRFGAFNAFVDFTMQDLPRAEVLVWLALFRDTKQDGIARTSQADIARRAGVNVGTVKRAVAGLRRRGLLAVVFRGSLRRGPSAYRVRPLTRDYKK
jgi:hypothetical protein